MPKYKTFEDIPELSPQDAQLHPRYDYTYIINAEKYQQTGEIELKRVLKDNLNPHVSAAYVCFRREGCTNYPLSDKDLLLANPNGKYVSPLQMNSAACNNFLDAMNQNPEIKENMPDVRRGRKGTSGYMDFVRRYPDKEHLKTVMEDYTLAGFSTVPTEMTEKIARQLNLTDENGNVDATRLPLCTIAALPTHVVSTGNGNRVQRDIPKLSVNNLETYSSQWINCSNNINGKNAFRELQEIPYLTEDVIAQYQTMGLAGADNFAAKYQEAIKQKEEQDREAFRAEMRRQQEEAFERMRENLNQQAQNISQTIRQQIEEQEINPHIENIEIPRTKQNIFQKIRYNKIRGRD